MLHFAQHQLFRKARVTCSLQNEALIHCLMAPDGLGSWFPSHHTSKQFQMVLLLLLLMSLLCLCSALSLRISGIKINFTSSQ